MPIYDVRSISQVGTTEPFEIQLARGQIPGHSFVHVIGAVPAMSVNTTGTVWDINDTLYPWSAFDTASVLNIPAVVAGDNGKRVVVYGLDADYNEVSESFTLSSTATVTGSVVFKRVQVAYYFDGGYNAVAIGNINIRVGTTVVSRIRLGRNQTFNGVYTVPAGYTAYITQGVMTCQSGADATGNFYVRQVADNHFRVGHTFEVTGGGEYVYQFTVPFKAPEKTDIDVRASVRSNNARVTAAYDIILIKETGQL